MTVELRHLRCFAVLAEELHFGRAAQRLAIAQPSLTTQIQALERELGLRLLDRGTRRVALTEAGEAYIREARAILLRVEEAAVAAHRVQRGELGRLSLGFVGLAALDTLPSLLRPFRARYPDIAVALFEQANETQIASIRAGTLDVGIVREPARISGTAMLQLSCTEQVLALPAAHKLVERDPVDLAELHDQPFVMPPRGAGTALYDRIIGACAAAGFSPHIAEETVRMTTMIGLVAANIGVAVLPPIARQIRLPGVVYRRLLPAIEINTGLIWLAEHAVTRRSLWSFLESAQLVAKGAEKLGSAGQCLAP